MIIEMYTGNGKKVTKSIIETDDLTIRELREKNFNQIADEREEKEAYQLLKTEFQNATDFDSLKTATGKALKALAKKIKLDD